MKHSEPKLLGVVLCGGRSKRMGRDKAGLSVADGRSFLQVATERLHPLCDRVCVSAQRPLPPTLCTIVDPPNSHGPISGIDASLNYAQLNGFAACLFNPIDTPCLDVDDLRLLVQAWRSDPTEIICAVAGQNAQYVEPLIAIYPLRHGKNIRAAIERERYSLQTLITELGCVRVVLPPTSCRNFNTPADLTDR